MSTKNNSHCDRCGSMRDPCPRGHGFGRVGYKLCILCANTWENLIRSERYAKQWNSRKSNPKYWRRYAEKLLKDFVLHTEPDKERVQFT